MRGATLRYFVLRLPSIYFNPRSSCEERRTWKLIKLIVQLFQSTLLMRGATREQNKTTKQTPYFNPRSSCEERLRRQQRVHGLSIFQSTLLMRGATQALHRYGKSMRFQSTLLMRGATRTASSHTKHTGHFNPRSSCEERPPVVAALLLTAISIHAPHARSDSATSGCACFCSEFQSTLLMRGATSVVGISQTEIALFQSTLLMRGATTLPRTLLRSWLFQSTLLMRGATAGPRGPSSSGCYFNPRSSCEERLLDFDVGTALHLISIHAPHARSDLARNVV